MQADFAHSLALITENLLILCMLGNFPCFCCHMHTFFKMNFFIKKSFWNTDSVSNDLDPDMIWVQTVCNGSLEIVKVPFLCHGYISIYLFVHV